MRAANPTQLSTLGRFTASSVMVNLLVAVCSTVLLLLVWRPIAVHAQSAPPAVSKPVESPAAVATQPRVTRAKPAAARDTGSQSHTVKAGETLWSLATRYYGDGHAWRALARRNGIATSGEIAVRVGTVLTVPSRQSVAAAASTEIAPRDTATPRVAMAPASPPLPPKPAVARRPVGALSAQTASKSNAPPIVPKRTDAANNPRAEARVSAVRESDGATALVEPMTALRPPEKAERTLSNGPGHIGLVNDAELHASRRSNEPPTVFLLRVADESKAATSARAVVQHAAPEPRRGEYLAAPFPLAEAAFAKAGRIARRRGDTDTDSRALRRMQLNDEVDLVGPPGAPLAVGERLVAVAKGAALSSGAVVGIPSGVLVVTSVAADRSARALVHAITGVVEQGEAVFRIEGAAAPIGQHPEPTTGSDLETTVAWVDANELLPTVQSFVMLSAGTAAGVKQGEEFALVRKAVSGAEERIAVVRVVRVESLGSTAIVIRQSLPAIASGVRARRIAKFP